ncbi:MAG: bifunctional indole-3-glycerol-phosphate synthase TrpC/phosphoribosylanthranilate isomerase TrpF [Opitutales bacterium]|nr:bifunctional indole-3-glycerol-phosphate synthase TrpC/phosphoribosylanthranilate isomerase TrpF [Opitutales bacterium]
MNILSEIVAQKRLEIAARRKAFPLEQFVKELVPADRDFYKVLEDRKHAGVPAFILECKKASPSQGLIRADFDPAAIADVYKKYADVISVLCDEKFFQGDYKNLSIVRSRTSVPVLCKEFIIDEYQVYLARHFGADAILLMLSVLDDETYLRLENLAHRLGMGVLTEADSHEDIERANALGARVVGINNRNLRTLQTDIERSRELAGNVRKDAVCVAESGLHSHGDAKSLSAVADAFLVGTALMRQENLDRACRRLIFGENKVCGLDNATSAQAALSTGTLFGGLIFAKKSPRLLTLPQALEIKNAVPALDYVAVFKDNPESEILDVAGTLKVFAVQLHGNESDDFAHRLRERLPVGTQIWRALDGNALTGVPVTDAGLYDRYILDGGSGGGKSFDWSKIPEKLKSLSMLAGGIGASNARDAHRVGCLGVEFNSAVESVPGKKSPEKIAAAFEQLRKF